MRYRHLALTQGEFLAPLGAETVEAGNIIVNAFGNNKTATGLTDKISQLFTRFMD